MGQRGYKQLTARDRLLIAKLQVAKLSLSEIARRIGKDKSTVSRELRRNAVRVTPQDRFFYFRVDRFWSEEQLDEFLATQPQRAWLAQQKRRRKAPATRKWVIEKLCSGWSPDQIAGRSKVDGPESVSHEYVYAWIHRDKKRGGQLYRLLKRFGRENSGLVHEPTTTRHVRATVSALMRGLQLSRSEHVSATAKVTFSRLTQRRLDEIADLLNHRPRKCLGYLTPHEVHFKKAPLRTQAQRCT